MSNLNYLNIEYLREESRSYFERDFPQYQRGTTEYNKYFDAYRHTYSSAVLTREFGDTFANTLGQINELVRFNNPSDQQNQDLWNNKTGRGLAYDNPTNDILAQRVKQSFRNGDLILNRADDQRKYEYQFVKSDYQQCNVNLNFLNSIKNLGSALNHASPLAIDLDGDGIESTNMKDGTQCCYWN